MSESEQRAELRISELQAALDATLVSLKTLADRAMHYWGPIPVVQQAYDAVDYGRRVVADRAAIEADPKADIVVLDDQWFWGLSHERRQEFLAWATANGIDTHRARELRIGKDYVEMEALTDPIVWDPAIQEYIWETIRVPLPAPLKAPLPEWV